MSGVELVVVEAHDQVCNMLLALNLLAKQLEKILQVVVKVSLKSVNHSVIVVLFDSLLDVLAFEQDLLLAASNGVNQVRVILVIFILQVELIQDVLILSNEVVNELSVITIILLARTGEEADDDTREEVRSQVDVVDDAVNFLVGQQALVQALVKEVIVQNNNLVNCLDLLQVIFEFVEVGLQHLKEHVV